MKKFYILLAAAFLFTLSNLSAQQPVKDADWSAYNFLIGQWAGEGNGAPGQGTGIVTFSYDLQKRVIVRRNETNFPKTDKAPAFSHNDLMVIYQQGDKTLATYWDNEGHTINYTVTFSADAKKLYFTSDIIPQAPRFRLVYDKLGENRYNNIFEIASPGKPEEFSKYLEGVIIKK